MNLHPLLAHHVLNTLGWPALRPLQQAALGPVQTGEHVLVVAPTAGGKTEAALFPLLSRMLEEDWRGLTILYLCPLRALLNNLHPRVERYASLIGRRAELWHGDIGDTRRDAIRDDPPDVLLTTPESIEAMLISGRTDHRFLFRDVRAVVVDEIHAFAGDDRGWHLLAVTERVRRIAGRELQRVGLSATVGNPEDLLGWLTATCRGPARVVSPSPQGSALPPEVMVDHVGSLGNAAVVISRLHRGEKRLVFVDSRARAEELAAELRARDVDTHLSHGSLSRAQRRSAETAFSEARDCVIVATSTLELGIDVGDLDRVVQIDAPPTVASFLQRLGRTGRRPGLTSNTLFLATRQDAFLHTLGLLRAWRDGFVEPLVPPPLPLHLAVQQLLAIVLQERGAGRHTWREWLGDPFVLGEEVAARTGALTGSLLARELLFDDSGILGIGTEGHQRFGRRHFLDLMSVFSDPPTLTVMFGRSEIGHVPLRLLTLQQPDGHVLLLAGRNWDVIDVDWRRGVVHVEPAPERGKIRWFGGHRALSFEICQAMRHVLAGGALDCVTLSRRASTRLEELQAELWWLDDGGDTFVVPGDDRRAEWWTFGGGDANVWLAAGLGGLVAQTMPGDLSIRLEQGVTALDVSRQLRSFDPAEIDLGDAVVAGAIERLKFADALPEADAREVVVRRLRADDAVRSIARSRPVQVEGAR